jgi:hypothetical protein
MDLQDLNRIVQNNKNVSFIKGIMNGIYNRKLLIGEYDGDVIVYTGSYNEAVRKNDYIEFSSNDDAQWFVDNYKDYGKEKTMEEMSQREFEGARQTNSVKWKYSGIVEKIS